MPAAVIFAGLGWGMLLAAVGLVLWDGFREAPGLSRAVQAVRWLAGATLLLGTLLAWWRKPVFSGHTLPLLLMAALAAPPGIHRRRSPWGRVLLILPALILAGSALFWAEGSVGARGSGPLVTPMGVAMAFCGGLGARALGEAGAEMAGQAPTVEWPAAATYALLTLSAGGAALVNLWQRGTVWGGNAGEGGLVGTWLVWSAAWLVPRERSRPRAGLIIVASSLLIVLAARR